MEVLFKFIGLVIVLCVLFFMYLQTWSREDKRRFGLAFLTLGISEWNPKNLPKKRHEDDEGGEVISDDEEEIMGEV